MKNLFTSLIEAAKNGCLNVSPNYFLGRSSSVLIPTNTSILDKITGKNWLGIGDSAITHDPISSYGLNFALKTSF
jgi:hypothetical protein